MKILRFLVILSLITGVALILPSTSHAEDAIVVPITWEGETTVLTWNNRVQVVGEMTAQVTHTLVPGDRITQGGSIRVEGPGPAEVTVEIVDVTTTGLTSNSSVEESVRLIWTIAGHSGDRLWKDARLALEKNQALDRIRFPLGQGEEFPVLISVVFPWNSTIGAGDPARLSYSVRITVQGMPDSPLPPHRVPTGGTSSRLWGVIAWTSILLGLIGVGVAIRTKKEKSHG